MRFSLPLYSHSPDLLLQSFPILSFSPFHLFPKSPPVCLNSKKSCKKRYSPYHPSRLTKLFLPTCSRLFSPDSGRLLEILPVHSQQTCPKSLPAILSLTCLSSAAKQQLTCATPHFSRAAPPPCISFFHPSVLPTPNFVPPIFHPRLADDP